MKKKNNFKKVWNQFFKESGISITDPLEFKDNKKRFFVYVYTTKHKSVKNFLIENKIDFYERLDGFLINEIDFV